MIGLSGCTQSDVSTDDFADYIAASFWQNSGEIQQQELCSFWKADKGLTRTAFIKAYEETGDQEFLKGGLVWRSFQDILDEECLDPENTNKARKTEK